MPSSAPALSKRPAAVFLLSMSALFQVTPATGNPTYVRVETNAGPFTLALDGDKAPVSVANFLGYLNEGFYKDTIFHRSPKNFVVQGGGFDRNTFLDNPTPKATHDPIINEASNGLSNLRGSLAMARTSDPNSATSQFYINVVDNTSLDLGGSADPAGYAVFGQVVQGMDTVDSINALPVASSVFNNVPGVYQDLPLLDTANKTPVYIQEIYLLQPTAHAGPDQTVDENGRVALDGGASTDAKSAIAAYHWTQTGGPTVALSDPAAVKPEFIAPLVEAETALSFALTVTDAAGAVSVADTVTVLIRDASNPDGIPYATAGTDFAVNAGEAVALDGSASRDPNGQALIYRWTQLAGPAVTLSDPAAVQPNFTAPAVTTNAVLSFSLTVTDAEGHASAPALVNVTVKRHNTAPVAAAGAGGTIRAGASLNLDGSASYDPDKDALASYAWTAPAGVVLSDKSAVKPSALIPTNAVGKTLAFSLTVSDGEATSPPASVEYTVVENSAPALSADPVSLTVKENAPVTLTATATDPDGDSITYRWTQTGGAKVTLDQTDGPSLSFTAPLVSAASELQFSVTATDGYTADPGSATATVLVKVDNNPKLLDCSAARAVLSNGQSAILYPPTGGLTPVVVSGIAAPTTKFKLHITSVTSDEPVTDKATKDRTGPDAMIVRGVPSEQYPQVYDYVFLRAERQTKPVDGAETGNGRVYGISFRARYGKQTCEGTVGAYVPGPNGEIVNDGQNYRATKKK